MTLQLKTVMQSFGKVLLGDLGGNLSQLWKSNSHFGSKKENVHPITRFGFLPHGGGWNNDAVPRTEQTNTISRCKVSAKGHPFSFDQPQDLFLSSLCRHKISH